MVDQAEIHRKAVSNDVEERKDAAHQFKYNFAVLHDKEQVWKDLVRLTHDENGDVRWQAIYAIDVAFQQVSSKEHAWKDLHRLTQCEDSFVRLGVASAIGTTFQHIPDKEQAWEDLRRLTHDEDSLVRPSAVGALGAAFQHIPDKKQVWDDLHRLVQDEDHYVRSDAARAIGTAFQHVPDKKQAWEDVHRLTQRRDSSIRPNAARAIGFAFQHIPDKKQAWEDLHWLARDEDSYVRRMVVYALGDAFQHIPDKEEAWQDLHWLTGDEDGFVRLGAARALGSAFQHIPEKDDAWNDLHRMILNEDRNIQHHAVYALGLAFPHVPDKKQAWKVLHRLTNDKDDGVRRSATDALGSDFQYVPEKEEAWKDLHRLTGDEDLLVRLGAACALGSNFQHIPEKDEAWRDMIWLTADEDSGVRVSANHSLGRASILKATATETEEDFRKELKNALSFFEKSLKEERMFNPSSFCLPFYRSFYTVTFEEAGAEGAVQKYLAEAKSASEGSKNKETLLEAVENLVNALSEAHKATDFGAMKSDLNAYRQYCDRAADLIGDAEEVAPGAARFLRRGLPIIGERIKEIIREIQEKAEAVCRETQGTPLEELGLATARSAQKLPTQDPLALMMELGNMAEDTARNWCEYLPPDKKVDACEQLKNLTDMEILERSAAIIRVFEYVRESIHVPKIHTVHVSETKQEIVRIAVAQISFELTESFPFTVKNRDKVKTKVFSALEIAKQNGANIVCLPELCLCEDWIGEIEEQCPGMIVIGGSFYKDNRNTCPVIMESDAVIPYQPKITPAVVEYDMLSGDGIYRYETRFGKFVILICTDFDDLAHYFREADIDMIFCPAFNSANERFWSEAHSHVERTPSYILIANTGLHGGTSIFGQLDNKYFGELADHGCKERKDMTYKLCEVKEGCEEVIFADFNLIHKSVQKPTPSNQNKMIKSVDNIRKFSIQPNQSRIKS